MIWQGGGVKGLMISKKSVGGRTSAGRISVWHRGSGVKRNYRIIDFSQTYVDLPFLIRRLEYDPNRNGFIALVCYVTGVLSYILAYSGIVVGSVVLNNRNMCLDTLNGSRWMLRNYGSGTPLNGLDGGRYSRSASVCSILLTPNFGSKKKKFSQLAQIQLASKEERLLGNSSLVACGRVLSNVWKARSQCYGKAGSRRQSGRRPVVRGVAMNPVDHPHGGGEGRGKGRISTSPWGWLTKVARKRTVAQVRLSDRLKKFRKG